MDARIIRLQNTFPGAPKPAPQCQNEPKQEQKVAEGRMELDSNGPTFAEME
jgi:hypothetical protein